MHKEDIGVIAMILAFTLPFLVMALIASRQEIKEYQLCLDSGASVEYCENNI